MADLAKLVVRLEAQSVQFQQQLEAAQKKLARFDSMASVSARNIATGVAAAAVAAGAAFGAMAKQAIDSADQLNKMAQSTGLSTESLSQLKYAADLSGASMEQVGKAILKLQQAQASAAKGSKEVSAAFKAIGVESQNADGTLRSTEDVMLDVADRFAQLEDGAGKAAIATQLFGKSGADLIPFLNQGRAGIEALKNEADAFGLTVGSKAAAQAEVFNDNLSKLKAATMGLVNQFVERALPTLVAITDAFVESAKSGGLLDSAVGVLAVTFKTLVTAGVIVFNTFQRLGRMIYAVGAAVVRVAQGEFKLAAGEISDAMQENQESAAAAVKRIQALWSDTVPGMEAVAKGTDTALKKSIAFSPEKAGDAAAKARDAALESLAGLALGLRQQVDTYGQAEVAVLRYRLAQGDLAKTLADAGPAGQALAASAIASQEALDKLADDTKAAETAQAAWNKAAEEGKAIAEQLRTPAEVYADTIAHLNDLLADGHILQETYNRAVLAAQETFDKASKEQNKFLEEANRQVQQILGDGITEIMQGKFEDGAKGALKAFTNMIDQMVAQALAAQLAAKLFGADGMGSGGGWLGQAGNFLSGLFTRDSGGRGRSGQPYLIGAGAQPELFVPDSAGTFYPRDQWMGGGGGVTQNIYVQGSVDQRTARQIELDTARRQRQAARFD